jgi:predicted ATP-grasp superfamily ATP-dependent carboligase/thymidylate kinase
MFTVTLIGPDGVGKTTVSKELVASFKLPIKYIYMGMNVEASNIMLPTTRWWETRKKNKGISGHVIPKNNPQAIAPEQTHSSSDSLEQNHEKPAVSVNLAKTKHPRNIRRLVSRKIRKSVGLGNRVLEEWYRQLVAWIYVKRGFIVLFDRHFIYDYYHQDMQTDNKNISLKRRIHGFVLRHTLREPDLLIILDAPGQVVFARKGEFNPEFLEIKRNQYLQLQNIVKNSTVIDATLPLESVVHNTKECIVNYYHDRKGMQDNQKYKATVLVTDVSRGCSIAIIRSLGRAGYRVIAADSDPKCIGFKSKYVWKSLVYPSPEVSPDKFTACLLNEIKSHRVDLIIPTTELVIQPIIKNRELFEAQAQLALPPTGQYRVVTNKQKTMDLAKKLGVPVPRTQIVETAEDALKYADELGWPIVLKPITSAKMSTEGRVESFEVTYAASKDELQQLMQKFEGKCEVLLQKYHDGIGYGIEVLMHEGNLIAAFSHKRLREYPISGGASSYRESVELDEALFTYADALLKELKWTGLAMVEFKVDGREKILMEINGRVWGSLPLAIASGVDFPLMLAELILNGPESAQSISPKQYKIGLRCRDLQRDVLWIACVLGQKRKFKFFEMPGRMRAIYALAGFFNPNRKSDLLCLDDPIPAFFQLPAIVKKLAVKSLLK